MSADWLDRLTGDWTYESYGVPDDPAHRKSGTETVVRRGVWTVIESSDGGRFQLAFGRDGAKVVGDFVHWTQPDLWVCNGAVEDDRLHLRSRGPSFDVEGEETDYVDVLEIVSPDERTLTGRLKGADGQWRDFLVARYRRKT